MVLLGVQKFRSSDGVRGWGSLRMRRFPLFCLLLPGIVPVLALPAYSADNPRTGLVQAAPATVGLLASRLKQIDNALAEIIDLMEVTESE